MRSHPRPRRAPLAAGRAPFLVGVLALGALVLGVLVLSVAGIVTVQEPAAAQQAATTSRAGGQAGGQTGGQVGGQVGGQAGGDKRSATSQPRSPQPTQVSPGNPSSISTQQASSDNGAPRPLLIALGGFFGLLIGVGGGFVLGRVSKRSSAAGAPSAAGAGFLPQGHGALPSTGQVNGQAERERARLVTAVIDVRDELQSDALREWLRAALAEVGVVELVADGQPFDPQSHQAVDQVPANDPAWDRVVARTARPGYSDRGAMIRQPQVAVYRFGT